jgi:hypothetical protein
MSNNEQERHWLRKPWFWVVLVLVFVAIYIAVTSPYRRSNQELQASPPVSSP